MFQFTPPPPQDNLVRSTDTFTDSDRDLFDQMFIISHFKSDVDSVTTGRRFVFLRSYSRLHAHIDILVCKLSLIFSFASSH